jgi:uncharacterized protein YkvS
MLYWILCLFGIVLNILGSISIVYLLIMINIRREELEEKTALNQLQASHVTPTQNLMQYEYNEE